MSALSKPVILILGAGSNIGARLTTAFAAKGYAIATVSRKPATPSSSFVSDLHIPADLSIPTGIPAIFTQVKEKLGGPDVVVFNASFVAFTPPSDPFSLSTEDLDASLNLNIKSVFAAAKEFVRLGGDAPPRPRTFILTGNMLNTMAGPGFISLGIGKSAGAHIIAAAAMAYGEKGYRFYYADERTADGTPAYEDISGDSAAEFYPKLVEGEAGGKQGPWLQTFAKGIGYKDFGPYHL